MFDIRELPFHKMTVDAFISQHRLIEFCEAIVYPDGTVQYAVPSHLEKLERIYQELCVDSDIIEAATMYGVYGEDAYLQWLVDQTKCVCVWYRHIVTPSEMNPIQRDSVERLSTHGIIHINPYY